MKFKWFAPVCLISWDDEIVVYHVSSGNTYLFANAAMLLLSCCYTSIVFSKESIMSMYDHVFTDRFIAEAFIDSFLNELILKDLIVVVDAP